LVIGKWYLVIGDPSLARRVFYSQEAYKAPKIRKIVKYEFRTARLEILLYNGAPAACEKKFIAQKFKRRHNG
jgi:hypothetical protein